MAILFVFLALKKLVASGFLKVHEELDVLKAANTNLQTGNQAVNSAVNEKLPINSTEEFSLLEEWLSDEANKSSMVLLKIKIKLCILKIANRLFHPSLNCFKIAHLSTTGGRDSDSVNRRILNKVFTKEFAEKTNWSGAHEKTKFSGTNLYEAVKCKLKQNVWKHNYQNTTKCTKLRG